MAKKGYIYPIKKKIPLILLLNLFGSFIVSQFFPFVNRFCEFYKITFRKGQQRLFGVSGRLPPSLLHKGAVWLIYFAKSDSLIKVWYKKYGIPLLRYAVFSKVCFLWFVMLSPRPRHHRSDRCRRAYQRGSRRSRQNRRF